MIGKQKITISISKELLDQVDREIKKLRRKNRSQVIEQFVVEGITGRNHIGAIIIANDNNWNDGEYPLGYPKCLIKVDGKTLLEKHLESLKKANIKQCVIALGHEKEQIYQFLKNKCYGIEILFCECNTNDKSHRVIQKCSEIIQADTYLVLLGDNYFYELHLSDFLNYHNTNQSPLSIIVKVLDKAEGYGNIKLEGNNIIQFIEKPSRNQDLSYIVNTGIYLIQSEILIHTEDNQKIENDFFSSFVVSNQSKAYFHNGKWFHLQDNHTLSLLG